MYSRTRCSTVSSSARSGVVGADRQQPGRLVEHQHVLVLVEPVEARSGGPHRPAVDVEDHGVARRRPRPPDRAVRGRSPSPVPSRSRRARGPRTGPAGCAGGAGRGVRGSGGTEPPDYNSSFAEVGYVRDVHPVHLLLQRPVGHRPGAADDVEHQRGLARQCRLRRRPGVRGGGSRSRPALPAGDPLGAGAAHAAGGHRRTDRGAGPRGHRQVSRRHAALHPPDVLGRERDGAARSRVDPVRAGHHQDEPARPGEGVLGVPVHLPAAQPRAGADPRQGGVPVSAGRPGHRPGARARFRQRGDVRSARQRRRADRAEHHVREGRRLPHADSQRHLPQRHHPPAGDRPAARRRRDGGGADDQAGRAARGRRDLLDRQPRQGGAVPALRVADARGRARSTARPASCTGPSRTAAPSRPPPRAEPGGGRIRSGCAPRPAAAATSARSRC